MPSSITDPRFPGKSPMLGRPHIPAWLADAPEDAVPPLAGQDELPGELALALVVPAVDATAGAADEAVAGAAAQAMTAMPVLRHASTLAPVRDHEDTGRGAL